MDPSSPIFMRGDTIYLPCIFVTWHGHSVDEKTPLLRSVQAMSKEGKRLMKVFVVALCTTASVRCLTLQPSLLTLRVSL